MDGEFWGKRMGTEAEPWKVVIIGLGSAGLFHLERLSSHCCFRTIGVCERQSGRAAIARELGCVIWTDPLEGCISAQSDVVLLTEDVSFPLVQSTLAAGKHVVLDRPWSLTSAELQSLAELAVEKGAKSLLLPVGCRRQLFDLSDEMATKLDIEFYQDARDALLKSLAE